MVQPKSYFIPPSKPKKPGKVDFEQVDKNMGIMEILKEADSNKDGRYNKDELKNALKRLGAIFPGWRANRCLSRLDFDNDGHIGGDEEIEALLEYLCSRGFGK